MKTLFVLGLLCVCLLSGCGYRLGLGPQRVADATYSGPVRVDLTRPNSDLPTL
jgi:hypothetical protein